MGTASSKVCKENEENIQEGSIPSTPIVTPKVFKQELIDPRSPSTHISRTPLQLLSAVNLGNFDDGRVANLDTTPAKTGTLLLGLDPRSPTAEFKRTPIIINASESDVPEKIHNKNLEKIKRSVLNATPKSCGKKGPQKTMSTTTTPKLLKSSPIKVKLDMNKRKSFVGLLETNIDFTETDLDVVFREKSKIKENICETVTTPKQQICTVQSENIDPRSPTNDFIRTPIQLVKKISDLDLNSKVNYENASKCMERETRSEIDIELEDHIIIEKCIQEICEKVHLSTHLGTHKNDQCLLQTDMQSAVLPTLVMIEKSEDNLFNTEIQEAHSEESVIPCEIKSAPISPKPNNNEHLKRLPDTLKETKSAPVSPPRVNLTADVKEFDKKLTNLIYHDEDVIICPRKVKLKDYDTRLPLKSINNSEPIKKSHKLKVNDRVKSEYAVSKIPIFKEQNRIDVQCENTPPRNMEKRKVKVRKSHWDNADKTLII